MGRATNLPRAGLPGRRQYHAGFGARHPIVYDERTARFFYELDKRWGAILPDREEIDQQLDGLPENRYALYRNPLKIGVTVLERRLSAEHARRYRLHWSPNDVGRLRGRITDEIARLALKKDDMDLPLTSAIRVGDADHHGGGKFALVAEAGHPLAGFLAAEHEIVVNGLSGVFRNFRYPYDEYVPKMTAGRIYRGATPQQINACAGELDDLMRERPLVVSLDPIGFFAHQEL